MHPQVRQLTQLMQYFEHCLFNLLPSRWRTCHQSTLHHGRPSGDRADRVRELAFEVCEEKEDLKTAILGPWEELAERIWSKKYNSSVMTRWRRFFSYLYVWKNSTLLFTLLNDDCHGHLRIPSQHLNEHFSRA